MFHPSYGCSEGTFSEHVHLPFEANKCVAEYTLGNALDVVISVSVPPT